MRLAIPKSAKSLLTELHRALKQNGTLSFNDPHMSRQDAIAGVTSSRLFRLSGEGPKTLIFAKV